MESDWLLLNTISCNLEENKALIVEKGGISQLVGLLRSSSLEVQRNACGCLTNFSDSLENKMLIANSGAIPFFVLLAKKDNLQAQRNASGAILNLSHASAQSFILCSPRVFFDVPSLSQLLGEVRSELVFSGAVPALVNLLKSSDQDTVYYCAAALSNMAVDGNLCFIYFPYY